MFSDISAISREFQPDYLHIFFLIRRHAILSSFVKNFERILYGFETSRPAGPPHHQYVIS